MLMSLFTARRNCIGAKRGKEVPSRLIDARVENICVRLRADGRKRDHSAHRSVPVDPLARMCVDNYANAIQMMETISRVASASGETPKRRGSALSDHHCRSRV